jgi:hypothetical protein
MFAGKSATQKSAQASEREGEKRYARIGKLLVEWDFLAIASGR